MKLTSSHRTDGSHSASASVIASLRPKNSSDFVKLGLEILYIYFGKDSLLFCLFVLLQYCVFKKTFFFPRTSSCSVFTVAILQRATVKPPNIIALEKVFKFHAQPQTGAYSCYVLVLRWC